MEKSILYLEKPVTADEREIAAILEKVVHAFTSKNVGYLALLLADDARFEVLPHAKVSINKKAYLDALSKDISNIRTFVYRDIIIRVKNDKEATCYCVRKIAFKRNYTPIIREGCIKFAKRGDTWYIIEVK